MITHMHTWREREKKEKEKKERKKGSYFLKFTSLI